MINIQYVHIYIYTHSAYGVHIVYHWYHVSIQLRVYDVTYHKCMFVRQNMPMRSMGKHRSVKDLLSDMVLGFQDFKIWTVESTGELRMVVDQT